MVFTIESIPFDPFFIDYPFLYLAKFCIRAIVNFKFPYFTLEYPVSQITLQDNSLASEI